MEGQTVNIIIVLVCLVLSAFFSSSEAAFLSLQRTRLQHLVSTGKPGAALVSRMGGEPERMLSTVLLGNNIVNVLLASVATIITLSVVNDEESWLIVSTIVVTSVVLVFGEIVPKAVGVRYAERLAFLYARPLLFIEMLFLPIVAVLRWMSRGVTRREAQEGKVKSITEGEFRTLIDIGEAEGTFGPREAELLEGVFRFGDRKVSEVMTPRAEMVMVERGATLERFLSIHAEHDHDRFPVYEGEPDNVVGTVSVRDILREMAGKGVDLDQQVTDVLREAYFVPELKRVGDVFEEMRRQGFPMAFAVNERGSVSGLVTLKGLLEELVGSVGEEGEKPEEAFEAIDLHTYQVDGGMTIEEANEQLGLGLPKGGYETVAGFVLSTLGRMPFVGAHFPYKGLRVEVTEMRGLKIESVRITKTPSATAPAAGEQDGVASGGVPQK